MKKIIISIILIGIIVLVSIIFLISKKDESKVAEIQQEEISDNKNIVEKILENPPKLQDQMVATNKPENEKIMSVKTGEFIKIDPLHYASGGVSIERSGENYKIVMADNFSSAPGPDLYIYLSEEQNYKNIALGGVDTSKTLNVGVLKSTSGRQEYLVSKKDFEKYGDSVIIWCKSFNVQFSRADLK